MCSDLFAGSTANSVITNGRGVESEGSGKDGGSIAAALGSGSKLPNGRSPANFPVGLGRP